MAKIPNIEPYLYAGSSVPEIINYYLDALITDSSPESLLVVPKLQEILSTMSDLEFQNEIRDIFDKLYKVICSTYPDLCFVLEGRRKSLISTIAKIITLTDNGRSLENLRDIHAFRLTLLDSEPVEQIRNCYEIMNYLIPFFARMGFIPCDAETVNGTKDFDPSKHPTVIIPPMNLLKKNYQFAVKDYILHPKANGYQSLHVAFRDAKRGRYFEVQVRTFSMHIHAETGSANHAIYKVSKHDTISFDPTKVQMKGFRVTEDGTIYDAIGLSRSLEIISRQKTLPSDF